MRTTNLSITLCLISLAFNSPGDVHYATVFLLHRATNIWGLQLEILKTVEPFFQCIISFENNIPAIGLF